MSPAWQITSIIVCSVTLPTTPAELAADAERQAERSRAIGNADEARKWDGLAAYWFQIAKERAR